MREPLADLLARAIVLVERDAPRCSERIAERLDGLSVQVILDDERATLYAEHGAVRVDAHAGVGFAEVRSTSSRLLDLLSGADELYPALLANRVRVRVAPARAPMLFDVLRLLVEGCARSSDGRSLFDAIQRRAAPMKEGD